MRILIAFVLLIWAVLSFFGMAMAGNAEIWSGAFTPPMHSVSRVECIVVNVSDRPISGEIVFFGRSKTGVRHLAGGGFVNVEPYDLSSLGMEGPFISEGVSHMYCRITFDGKPERVRGRVILYIHTAEGDVVPIITLPLE